MPPASPATETRTPPRQPLTARCDFVIRTDDGRRHKVTNGQELPITLPDRDAQALIDMHAADPAAEETHGPDSSP